MRRRVVVAIAMAAVIFSSCSTSFGRAARSDQPPGRLVDVGWVLASVQREGHPPVDVPARALVVRGSGSATFDVSRCSQWVGMMHFHGRLLDVNGRVSPHPCPAVFGATGGPDLIEHFAVAVMQGSLRWSLDGGRLALTKSGIGVLTFSRGRPDPPSPSS